MLLSDEEISDLWVTELDDRKTVSAFARAIESALLAKLGAMELPEPVGCYADHRLTPDGTKEFYGFADKKLTPSTMLYTAAQLQQAYAQGAAAQLAHEPSAKQFQTPDGKWHSFLDSQHEEHTVNDGRWPIRELYTRREAK